MTTRAELRPLTLNCVNDAIAVMNASSAGRTFAFQLDLVKFLMLSRFWCLTYPYSYVAYVGGEPAGVLLNSVDSAAMEAYSFYWGVAEPFRRTRVAWELVHKYLGRVRREGYFQTSADTSTDSPMRTFGRLGYRAACELVEVAAGDLGVASCADALDVRPVPIADLIDAVPHDGTARPWTAKPFFLQGAESMLETLGAYSGRRLTAWLAATRFTGFTTMMLLGHAPKEGRALAQLIRELPERGFPAPFTASHIRAGSAEHAVLEGLGFRIRQRWSHITLDLTASSAR
ncbi:MAG TPA: hypothetical protein VN428_02180 [Bryobacteraceae bacterium]|nr:hypothetical protein [Bryobacteraceae bacterium]